MGSDRALFDVLRLFTVLHANLTAPGTYQEHLHDILLDDEERKRAAKTDLLVEAAVEALRGVMVLACPTGPASQVAPPPPPQPLQVQLEKTSELTQPLQVKLVKINKLTQTVQVQLEKTNKLAQPLQVQLEKTGKP